MSIAAYTRAYIYCCIDIVYIYICRYKVEIMRVKVGSIYYDMADCELPIYECLGYIASLKLLFIEKLMLTTVLNSSSSEVSTTCSHFCEGC